MLLLRCCRAADRVVDNDADKYFLPFKLACETDKAELRKMSLDYIEKMIAYGYLTGSALADSKVCSREHSQHSHVHCH